MSGPSHTQRALARLADGQGLDAAQMEAAMTEIMSGEATPAQIGGFLMALRVKGESVEEIAAAARVMRRFATPVTSPHDNLIDTCGTGGDGAGIFNVSTACAFVVAAAGGRVAKHGNRSVSSSSGSADVLEAAGVNLELTPTQVAACIDRLGVGFLFAPAHHGAVRHAVGPRRELAQRTLFNLLGPLTNPAGAPRQVMGVYDRRWLRPVAEVLGRLGSEHVLVVHARDGLDEISLAAETDLAELRAGSVRLESISPEDFGIPRQPLDSLRVRGARESLNLIRSALGGQPGPAFDIVALNAGAAIHVANLAPTLSAGVDRAREILADGAGERVLRALVELTGQFARGGDNA